MPIRCPQCSSPQAVAEHELGAQGRLVSCQECGTQWLARRFDDNPYGGRALELRAVDADEAEKIGGVVIDHVAAGFRPPPHRREERAPPKVPSRGSKALRAAGVILGAVAFLIVFRAPIMAALPQLATIRGLPAEVGLLEFTKVRSETVRMNGVTTFFVEGEIINRAPGPVELPAIKVSLKSTNGATVTSWLVEPAASGLAAGSSIGFRSALASPPADATQVTLNLAQREGQTIGLR